MGRWKWAYVRGTFVVPGVAGVEPILNVSHDPRPLPTSVPPPPRVPKIDGLQQIEAPVRGACGKHGGCMEGMSNGGCMKGISGACNGHKNGIWESYMSASGCMDGT